MPAQPQPTGAIGEHPFVDGPFARRMRLFRLPIFANSLASRAAAVILITWIPLLILTAVQGHAVNEIPRNSFLLDPVAYCRYMLAIPLLMFAERYCIPTMAGVVRKFGERGMIRAEDLDAYHQLLQSTRERLNSRTVEIVLLCLVLLQTVGSAIGISGQLVDESWRGHSADGAAVLSFAGWYATLISSPIYLIILYGWGWRLFLWGQCLFKLSKFNLRLQPNHPDQVGGLGFTLECLAVMPLLGFALTVAPAGGIADIVLFAGQDLATLKPVVIGFCVLVLALMVGPLLFFSMPLNRVRTQVLARASIMAYRQMPKEIAAETEESDDMGSGEEFEEASERFEVASHMKPLLVDLKQLPPVVIGILLPVLPVLLTEVPLKDILEKLKSILL